MKILRTYILKDFFSSFIFSLLSLTLVMLLGNLKKLSDLIIRKGINISDALKIFSMFMPYILGFTIPLATLMGVLLVMGRLIADNELIAINAAGISLARILTIFIIIGLILSLFLFILNDKVIPYFHYNYRSRLKNIYTKNINAIIEPGVYLENFKNTILYVDDIKENKLKNIYIYETNDKGLSRLTYAKYGAFVVDNNKLTMRLERGFRDEINPKGKKELYRLNFKVFFIELPLKDTQDKHVEKKASDMTFKELKERIRHFRALKIDPVGLKTELHKRASLSFSPITFIVLGFGISLVVRHREKSINFGIAISIAGLYYILLLMGEALTEHHYLTPLGGMWLPNITVASIGGFLILRNAYIR